MIKGILINKFIRAFNTAYSLKSPSITVTDMGDPENPRELIFTSLASRLAILHYRQLCDYLPQNLFCVMENVLLFFMSTGLIFYSLHRKAIEMPKAPMGTIIAVFSTTMNLFAFLGSLLARKLLI